MRQNIRRQKFPLVTWSIAITCAVTFIWQLGYVRLPEWLAEWLAPCSRAAIDNKMWHTTISYAWLHLNTLHLLGNISLLFACAQPFESSCGHIRTLSVYIVGAIAGAMAFASLRPEHDPQMLIGASGAVFSTVGAYAVALMKARHSNALGTVARANLSRRLVWVIRLVFANLFYGLFLSQGVSNMAHLGGLAAGAFISFFTIWPPRKKLTLPR